MTDETLEAVARAIVRDLWEKGFLMDEMDIPDDQDAPNDHDVEKVYRPFLLTAETALKAYEKSLAKAGLGIRPRKPSEKMVNVGRVRFWCDPEETDLNEGVAQAWQDMWDAYKPDG